MPGGRRWKLYFPFTYHAGSQYSREYYTVPKDFETDFASIPTVLWRFLFWWLPYWAKYSKPSPLHDFLYQTKPVTRKRADELFLEAMLVAWKIYRFGKVVAYLEYFAVRLFGWVAWKGK